MRNRADGRAICFRSMIVFTLLLSLAVPAQAQGTRVYTVDRTSNLLREINSTTGATIASVAITVATGSPPPTVRGVTGLAANPTTSKLYALLEFNALVSGSPQTRTLATIDPNTGVATLIGSALTRSYADITFSPGGTLYGITGDGSTNPSTLFIIDKSTAATTTVAVLGRGDDGEAIAFNSDNNLIYHMSGKNESGAILSPTMVLETIDPASPLTPPVNIPIVVGVVISEATAMVYEGAGRFLWTDLLNQPFPPTTSRLLTMTTGGVPAVRGTLTYTATGIAIVRVFNLNVIVAQTGNATGTVASVPVGVTCGSPTLTCPTPFVGGSQVTLTATPGANSGFSGWSGACTGTGPCVVDMNADKAVTATFSPSTIARTLTVTRTGTGTVTSTPAGTPALNCGSVCAVTFPDGTPVTLTATPSTGNSFVNWGAACSGTATTCNLTMSVDRTVSATFAANQTLTVTKAGTGTGTVTSNPAGISCGTTCDAPFAQNAVVVLSAVVGAGSSFASWSGGGCSGNSPTCTVTMNGAQTVTATFNTAAVPDFTFGPTPDNQVVHKTDATGGYGTYVVTINGTGGYTGSVTIGCAASTPSGATCVNPAPAAIVLTPDAFGASTGTSTVKVFVPISGDFGMPVVRLNRPWLWWLGMLFALLIVAPVSRDRRRGRVRVAAAAGGLLIVVLIAAVVSACGDDGEAPVGPTVTDYLVPITATSQSPQLQLQRTQIVRLQAVED